MKISIIILSVICLSVLFREAKAQFQWIISGPAVDVARSIIQTADGGYAVAGETNSFGAVSNYDIYVVKLTAGGTIQWSKTIGGGGTEYGHSIKQTADGGYILTGISGSFGPGGGDFYIVKLDAGGNLQWSRSLGGTGYDYSFSVVQTTDGGFALGGVTYSFGVSGSDFYIVKLDGNGALQWSKTIGGAGHEWANSIIQTIDGGYAMAGYTLSFGAGLQDFYIVKLDGSGSLQWSKTVGGINREYGNSIIQTFDGGFAITGYTNSFGTGLQDCYIVKLSSTGALIWTRTVGETNDDYAYSITQTINGGLAISGMTSSFGAIGGSDIYVIKLDFNGSLQLSKKVGRISGNVDQGISIIQTSDRGFAVAGYTSFFAPADNNFYVVKFDSLWNTCDNSNIVASISGTGGTLGSPVSIITSPTTIITSPTSSTGTGGVITQLCNTGIQSISNEIPVTYELYQNYPNPFNPTTKIVFDINLSSNTVLKVYDAKGDVVETLVNEKLAAGKYEFVWNAAFYPSGAYFCKLETGNFTATKKMILIK